MAQQLIVLVSNDQWRILHVRAGRCELRVFSVGTDSQQLLLNWLQQHKAATVNFLTDIADEHYHIEVLPRVSRVATRQLLTRRLAAWPFVQDLHTVHIVDTVQGLRKEDRYLFSAIHYAPLSEWLQFMQEQATRVRGVYTQAMCAPCWHSHLHPAEPQCCYVYYEKKQLRIRYLYKSRLVFSRLITLVADASLHARIISEIAQTRLYLMNQHWLQEKEQLVLYWLSEGAAADTLLTEQLPAGIRLRDISYADVSRSMKWKSIPQGLSVMDWAAVQVVINTRQLPNFAPHAVLLSERIALAKRNIIIASGIMMCLFVVTCWISQQCIQEVHLNLQKTTNILRLWQAAKPDLQMADADLQRVQALSQAVQELDSSVQLPDRALVLLQTALNGQEVWQVKEIEWHYGPKPDSFSQAGSRWIETFSITFSKKESIDSLNAHQQWQALLEKLRQQPEILELKEVNILPFVGDATQQGDTRKSSLPAAPTLNIWLRPPEKAGV